MISWPVAILSPEIIVFWQDRVVPSELGKEFQIRPISAS